MAACGQNFRGLLHRHAEIAGHGGESGQKQIAKAVAFKIARTGETILKQLGEKVFVFRDGHQAVANIAGRKHVQFTAQTSAGTAIITHGHDGGQIRNVRAGGAAASPARDGVPLQPFQQRGKAGSTTNGNHANSLIAIVIRLCWALPCFALIAFLRRTAGRLIRWLRIEQLSEPWIVGHVLEVRIIARLETVLWIHADGITQMS